MYDLFVVYAALDRDWVEGFLLSALGLDSARVITPEDFVLGAPVPDEFERAVTSSRFVALVLSPAFLDDRWSVLGEQLASYAGTASGRSSLVPILLEPCQLPLRLEFRVHLDCTARGAWEEEVDRLRALLDQPPPPDEHVPCPYPGLHPFTRQDARFFYGRDDEVADLMLRLRHEQLVGIIGPSGSGKSSLVFAGLLPELERVRRQETLVRSFRPGPLPVGALAACLGLPPEAECPSERLSAAVVDLLAQHPPAQRLLVVVDQLEEVFAQAPPAQQQQFFAALTTLRWRVPGCYLLFTARADFYADLMSCPLWPLGPGERVELVPLRGEQLRQVIVGPAREVGVHVEPTLVERLLRDAADEPGALPLMQETLVLLWDQRRRRLLTLDAYERLGGPDRTGLAVALAAAADGALGKLPPENQAMARRIFLRLVQLNDGRENTRRQQTTSEIRPDGTDTALFEQTLRHLTDHRLLTLSGEEGTVTVDLAHEALISAWPTLRTWIEESANWLPLQRQLSEAAAEWEALDEDPELLYGKTRLRPVSEAAEAHADDLTEPERRFLKASKAEVDRLEEEQRRHLALGARAARREEEAKLHRQAQEVLSLLPTRPRRALGLAIGTLARSVDALEGEILFDVQSSLHAAVRVAKERHMLSGHRSPVRGVALSPDGLMIASGSEDRTVRLWDTDGRPVGTALEGHDDAVTAVAFSPDGQTIASASDDGTVRLWDAAGSGVCAPLCGHDDAVTAVAFSPDGQTIASASDDGTVRFWDVTSRQVGTPCDLGSFATSVAFGPDGTQIVAGAGDGTVQIWDLSGPELRRRITGHQEFVTAVDFSPDGPTLASVSGDGTLRLWTSDGVPLGSPIAAGEGFVNAVTFVADGRALATAGHDQTVRLWDLDGKGIHSPLNGHAGPATSVAVGGDLTTIVTGGGDSTVRIWDWQALPIYRRRGRPLTTPDAVADQAAGTAPPPLWDADGDQVGPAWLGHREFVGAVAFAPDGRTIASAGGDRVLRLWGIDGDTVVAIPAAHDGSIMSVAYSPDSRMLVTGSRNGVVRLWDPRGNPIGGAISGSPNDVMSVAFAPDGRSIASGSTDGIVRLWDLRGRPLGAGKGHEAEVMAVAFNPDGSGLATAGRDGSVVLWDGSLNPLGTPLCDHASPVLTVTFDATGDLLASGGEDGTMCLWRSDGQLVVGPQHGHRAAVNALRFNPLGETVLSASTDGTLRLWDISGNAVAFPLNGHRGRVLAVSWHPDGELMVSGGEDATVRLWRLGGWRTWMRVACERLSPAGPTAGWPDDESRPLQETCRRALWEIRDGPRPSAG